MHYLSCTGAARIFVILLILSLCHFHLPLNAQRTPDAEIRERCLQSLGEIKHTLDSLLLSDSVALSHLQAGEIDSAALSIRFKGPQIRVPPGTEVPEGGQRHYKGIIIKFHTPIPRPATGKGVSYRWYFSDVSLAWDIGWPGAFPYEDQRMVMGLINTHLGFLNKREREAARLFLEESDSGSQTLTGKGGLRLSLESLSETPGLIMAKAFNPGVNSLYLSKLNYTWLINDSVVVNPLPDGFIREMVLRNSSECPFVKVLPLHAKEVRQLRFPFLKTGIYHLRIVASFEENHWVDNTPAFVDGSPIHHTEEDSWLGTLVSSAIKVEVGVDGRIRVID